MAPQLISDAVAYHLFLSAACEQPQSKLDEKARQRAILSRAQLAEPELAAMAGILAGYHQQMAVLDQSFSSTAAAGERPRAAADYAAQRDAIVTSTRAALAAQLSAGSMARLHQLVQSEKRYMKVIPFPTSPDAEGPQPERKNHAR